MMISRFGLAILLSLTLLSHAPAREAAPVQAQAPAPIQSQALIAFASDEGLLRLARSTARINFPALANQFEPQSNAIFCGPTTAAIVLNAVRGRSQELPRDRSRLRAEDLQYIPKSFDPSIPRFTQDNVIPQGQKKRAQVLGEPVVVDGKSIKDFGYQIHQFDEMLRANGLKTRLVIVAEEKSEGEIRDELVRNLKTRGEYAIINYKRQAVGQQGGGHISPLAAYDAQSDSFLVLDVNPASAGWVWMPTAVMVKGMRTFDTVANRGYILVDAR